MRKTLIFFLATALTISCNDKKPTDSKTTKDTTTTEQKANSGDNKMNGDDKGQTIPANPNNDVNTTDETGWTKSDEDNFMYSCVNSAKKHVPEQQANEYCDCMLQKLKVKYGTYTQANQDILKDTAAMSKMVNECNQ